MKTLFEKIFWTCIIINAILFAVGCFISVAELNIATIVLIAPFLLQFIFLLLYFLIIELLLKNIWGDSKN